MKKILLLFIIFTISPVLLGQTEEKEKKESTEMVVFPGCEKYKPTQKIKLTKCLQKELSQKIGEETKIFSSILEDFEVSEAICNIEFMINKNGEMTEIEREIKYNYINDLFGAFVEEILMYISQKIKGIKPGKNETGEFVNLKFTLPVKVKLEDTKKVSSDFLNYNQTVILTLKSDKKIYEVRRNEKNAKIMVYEKSKNSRAKLVEEFNSLSEFQRNSAYKKLLDTYKNRFLVTEKRERGKLYRIYKYWKEDKIEVFKVEGNKEVLEVSLNNAIFSLRKYMGWILRKV